MAAKLRAPVIELHTGAWCDAIEDGDAAKAASEWQRIVTGAALAKSAGLEVHAGHASITPPPRPSRAPEIMELNIGYYMIGEALFVGLGETVRRCAPRWRGAGGPSRDPRHRQRPDRHHPRRQVIERHGERFLDRIFTDAERAKAQRRAKNEKMLGGDLRQAFCRQGGVFQGARHRHPPGRLVARHGVVNLPGGRPTMRLTGGALVRLQALTPPGFEARIDLTITDDWRWRRRL